MKQQYAINDDQRAGQVIPDTTTTNLTDAIRAARKFAYVANRAFSVIDPETGRIFHETASDIPASDLVNVNHQNGWGWLNREGYCGDCASATNAQPELRPFSDGGYAVDYCCNCNKENPNYDEEETR